MCVILDGHGLALSARIAVPSTESAAVSGSLL